MLNLAIAQQTFDSMLAVGESRTGAAYGVFKPKGFFAGTIGNQFDPGYMAVTNTGRLLIIRTGSLGYFTGDNRVVCYDLSKLTKLKIHKNIFGQYVFKLTFGINGKTENERFQAARKVAGRGHPDQENNLEDIISVLSRYETP